MEQQAITFRLPGELYEWLRREAFETREAMNSIVIAALEDRREHGRTETGEPR
jgi:hypothetical protein